jgi:hypothetical protein
VISIGITVSRRCASAGSVAAEMAFARLAVHGRDDVDQPECGEGSAQPIANTSLATTIAVARFGPPPATAAHEPRH